MSEPAPVDLKERVQRLRKILDAAELRSKVARLERILNSTADMIMTSDTAGRILEFNASAERLLGYKRRDIRGKPAKILFHQASSYDRLIRKFERKRLVRGFATRMRTAKGQPLEVDLSLSQMRDKEGTVRGTVCVARDMTHERELAREVREKGKFLSEVLEHSAAMIVTGDNAGNITEFNPEATRVLGYSREEAIGRSAELLYLRKKDRLAILKKMAREGKVVEHDTKLLTKDRRVIDVSITMSYLKDDQGKTTGTVSVSRDVTNERKLEKRLERLSITDTLTELYNRRHFYAELKRCLKSAQKESKPFSLILFDVDGFKQYNDKHGHLAGDQVLVGIAQIVQKSIRRHQDIASRFGGDEFTLLLPDADAATALILSERIRRRFSQAGFGDCALSIGVAQHEPGNSEKTLLHRADEAMYAAKRAGGNRVEIA